MGVASSPAPQRPHPVRNPTRPGGSRTELADGEALDLVALVAAAEPGEQDGDPAGLDPEDHRILGSCREPVSVVEVAAVTALPVSVVRVRLTDLIRRGLVTLGPQPSSGEQPAPALLNEVLDGLRTI
jgi:hypothetical protein